MSYCEGEGKPVIYKKGEVHPHCSVCDRDLSVQGKHKRIEWRDTTYVAKRHKAES